MSRVSTCEISLAKPILIRLGCHQMTMKFTENWPSVGATPRKCLSARAAPHKVHEVTEPNSSRLAKIMFEKPAEFLMASDITTTERDRGRLFGIGPRQVSPTVPNRIVVAYVAELGL